MPGQKPMPVCILFGPTASGKTEILERLFAGPGAVVPAEVVSADSMQVYRGMDIGTAKPGQELLDRLPHHLIDIKNPDEQFNAGEFVRLADDACCAITGRGRLPVISGGTGFYLRNFVLGLPETPPSDPEIRMLLQEELRSRGAEKLMDELVRYDPVSAARIHINDEYRILRALEVYRSSGRPLSSFSQTGSAPDSDSPRPAYRFLIIGLRRPREELYHRINRRAAEMFSQGLPEEVRRLCEQGYGPGYPGLRAIGYQEFFVPGEDGGMVLSRDLPGVEVLIARNSRRYAKRQIVFFSSIPDAVWIDAGPDAAAAIRSKLEAFLASGA
ncbi:tRNA (adenosine(37)-N6)-dimethylallyltransferase MiaA [Breznakiella homolactica]|uniref:tRNA dimethylallyltransferase n=1 Tax=Breznakiella homolactica TaxID=2798577 RepID=A0A7T7XJE4_9SPIR|nr:tRNA (adenosine(37)-N6)-dimethylallyltransferase MiaA [Breznakiella homolactica]QQO07466.1 tRNA (adenosine(37)-N6)-dimethylallyltransferase MiaA [Breznakiella homolactica]